MALLFGKFEVPEGIPLLVYVLITLLVVAGIVAIWYKWRKMLWAFIIASGLALVIGIIIPLFSNWIFMSNDAIAILNLENWETQALVAFDLLQGGLLTLITRFFVNIGFDAARLEIGKQN